MKIMVCGYARHGKDTLCGMLGLPWNSSSRVALEKVIWPEMEGLYGSMEECFDDRVNKRKTWATLINKYNEEDKTRLSRDIFENSDVYCGIRNKDEFFAAKEAGLFGLAIWVSSHDRGIPDEPESSCTMRAEYCDVIVKNNGTLEDLRQKAIFIRENMIEGKSFTYLMSQSSVPELIANWADQVFPNRTVTDAIRKLALEELPEFLMNQDDPMELADAAILIHDIAHLKGWDLEDIIRQKMSINQQRSWEIDETTGHLKHTKKGEDL